MKVEKKIKKTINIDIDEQLLNSVALNAIPSPDDPRDFIACVGAEEKVALPEEYLAPETEILNQGVVGACVAFSCATALAEGEETLVNTHNIYSRGYIYGNRKDTDAQEEGMIMREALKQLHNCGDVYQIDFPYNKTYPKVKALIEERKEELAEKALPHKIVDYYRCYDNNQIKNAIINAGGVLICIPVYTDFDKDLHKTKTNSLKGYHAMIIVGWTKDDRWIVQNSWGKYWGYDGKLFMDFDYPVNEYWAITVSSPNEIVKPANKKSIFKKIAEFFVGIFNKLFKK